MTNGEAVFEEDIIDKFVEDEAWNAFMKETNATDNEGKVKGVTISCEEAVDALLQVSISGFARVMKHSINSNGKAMRLPRDSFASIVQVMRETPTPMPVRSYDVTTVY